MRRLIIVQSFQRSISLSLISDRNQIGSRTVGATVDCSQAGVLFLQKLQVTHHFDLKVNRRTQEEKDAAEKQNNRTASLNCD